MSVWSVGFLLTLVIIVTLQRRRRLAAGAAIALALAIVPLPHADAQGDAPRPAAAIKWFIGVDGGVSHLHPRGASYLVTDDSDHGARISGGYNFAEHWAVEAFYTEAGEARIAHPNPAIGDLGGVEYRMSGVGVIYRGLDDSDSRRFYPYLKSGIVHTNNSVTDPRILIDRLNHNGVYIGGGGAVRLAPKWRLHGELVSYDRDEAFLSLGIKFGF